MMLEELSNPLSEDEDDVVSSRIHHFDGNKSKMVGFIEIFEGIKRGANRIFRRRSHYCLSLGDGGHR